MSQNIVYLQSVISLALLAFVIFWLYRDFKVDSFRQKLFALRDDLFDDAEASGIDFSHSSYDVLRTAINGFIRYAHRINIFQILALVAIATHETKSNGSSFNSRFQSHLGQLEEDQQKLLKDYRNKMNVLMIKHALSASPLALILIFMPLGYLVKTHQMTAKILKRYRSQFNALDSAALARGQDHHSRILGY